MKQLVLILLLLNILSFPVSASPSQPLNTEDNPSGLIYMAEFLPGPHQGKQELKALQKEERNLVRMEHRLEKIQKHLQTHHGESKSGIFSNPVGRWLWIWLISWGFGLLLFALSNGSIGTFLGVLLLISFVVGAIALVVWLKKQFG